MASKVIGVCCARLQDQVLLRKISSLYDSLHLEGYGMHIFQTQTDLYNSTSTDLGEEKVFDLILRDELDAVVIFAESIRNDDSVKRIIDRCHKRNIPAICADRLYDGAYCITYSYEDNFEALVRHVIEHHKCKTVNYISGLRDNEFSQQREAVFKKVLAENGIEFDPRRLGYGDFWSIPTKEAMDEFFETGLPLPEAFICVNDSTAIAVCEYLYARGIMVPEDVLVTGFDGIERIMYHSPRITTASLDYAALTKTITQLVLDLASGTPCQKNTVLSYTPMFSESCGCEAKSSPDTNRLSSMLFDIIYDFESKSYITNEMAATITDTDSLTEMVSLMIPFLPELYLGYFFFNIYSNYLDGGDENEARILFHLNNSGASIPLTPIPSNKLVTDEASLVTNSYLFTTVHTHENIYGYLAIGLFWAPSEALARNQYLFNMNLNEACSTVINNKRLSEINEALAASNRELAEIYSHDHLTKMYNRSGFYLNLPDVIAQRKKTCTHIIVASVDMDNLKKINDKYGHAEGDFAIANFARILDEAAGKGNISARFGGDEFVVVTFGSDFSDNILNECENRLSERLDAYNNLVNKPYKLEASSGCVIKEIGDDIDIEALISEADALMYKQKAQHKLVQKQCEA